MLKKFSSKIILDTRRWTPFLILGVGIVAISFASIFIKLCRDVPSMVIASYRLGISSVFFLSLSAAQKFRITKIYSRDDIKVALLGGAFLSLHFATWISSLKYTSVTSSVVLVQTAPLFVALGSFFILKEKVAGKLILGMIITIAGGITIGAEDWSKGVNSLYGDVLALLGAIGASGYLLIGRNLRAKIDTVSYVSVVYSVTALILILITVFLGLSFTGYSKEIYLLFILIAMVPQVIGHTSFNWALRYLSASLVAVTVIGEPVGATLLAYFILGERLTWVKAAGGALILTGVYLSIQGESKK